MGCCTSKELLTTDSKVNSLRHEGVSRKALNSTLEASTKTSHGSSTIRAGANLSHVSNDGGYSISSQTSGEGADCEATVDSDEIEKEVTTNIDISQGDNYDQVHYSTSQEWKDISDDSTIINEPNRQLLGEIDYVIDALHQNYIFQFLDSTITRTVAAMMKTEWFEEGEVIVQRKETQSEDDCMYYLGQGTVEVRKCDGSEEEKSEGWFFGDIELLFGLPCSNTVIAKGECLVYSLDRADFIQSLHHVPEIRTARFLRKLPVFGDLGDYELMKVVSKLKTLRYEEDEAILLKEGTLCIVRKGRVGIEGRHNGYVISRGSWFEADQANNCFALSGVDLILVPAAVHRLLEESGLAMQLIKESILQLLFHIGTVDVGEVDLAEIITTNSLITLSNEDLVVGSGQVLDHAFVIVKGDIEIRSSNKTCIKIRHLRQMSYFGEKWDRRLTADTDIVVVSETAELIKIPHEVLRKAGAKKSSRRQQISSRVLDLQPTGYSEPEISFRDLIQYRVVGEGEYGSVRLVSHKITGQQYALKILHKSAVRDFKTAEHIIMERKMLANLDGSPFLVGLRGAYQDDRSIYLLMDWVPGGELFSRIIDCGGRLQESHAVFYAANVVIAYNVMHSMSILYRDLKPENMLIGKNGYLVLADYGFATIDDGQTWTVCGTPDYQAPEIISRQGASKASDCWALGILIYELLCGDAPFKSATDDRWDTHKRILSGKFHIPAYVSDTAADLITKLLQVDIEKRLCNLDEIKAHPWFRGVNWTRLSAQRTPAPYIPRLTNPTDTSCFDYYSSPKKAAAPSRNNLFSRERPWSNLWKWIDDF